MNRIERVKEPFMKLKSQKTSGNHPETTKISKNIKKLRQLSLDLLAYQKIRQCLSNHI